MQITSRSSTGYHPNAGIKSSHPSSVSRMRQGKGQTTLFSPKVFQVGTSGNSGVGVGIRAGEMGDDKSTGKTNSCYERSPSGLENSKTSKHKTKPTFTTYPFHLMFIIICFSPYDQNKMRQGVLYRGREELQVYMGAGPSSLT